MTVGELITALQALPGNLNLVVMDASWRPTEISKVDRAFWGDEMNALGDSTDPQHHPIELVLHPEGTTAVISLW